MIDQVTVLCQQIIRQTIKDLSGHRHYDSALEYVDSNMFIVDCDSAGYPSGLPGALMAMSELSTVARKYSGREILRVLNGTGDHKSRH